MAFEIIEKKLEDVLVIKTDKFYDDRGCFMELFKSSEFQKLGIPNNFPQINLSYSKKNVIRGLHYQIGDNAQGKLVRLIKGRVRDVFVDARVDSPNYGKVSYVDLSEEDSIILYIPTGFAHGFSVQSEEAVFLYFCTNEYNKATEGGINYKDPSLNIDWQVVEEIVSEKDKALPFFKPA